MIIIKRTKSIIALLTAVIMTIGITACGSGSTMDVDTNASPAVIIDPETNEVIEIPSPEGLPRGNSGKTGTTSSGIPRGNSGKTQYTPEDILKRYGEIETLVKSVKTPSKITDKTTSISNNYGTVDWSTANQGYITFTAKGANRMFLLQGPNDTKALFEVTKGDTIKVTLMDGTGKYQYAIGNRATTGTSWNVQYKNSFTVKTIDTDLAPYLVSTPWGDYENAPNAVKKAEELWDDTKTQLKNVQTIADWVADNLKYDLNLKQGSCSVYVNPDSVIENGGGVCNEFSKLLTAMLRSQGIPAYYSIGKAISDKSTSPDGTHAWVHAWIELETSTKNGTTYSKGAWISIEATDGNLRSQLQAKQYVTDYAN